MQRVLIVVMLIGTLLAGTAAQAATPFTDVPAGHLFETEIDWMAAEDITQGCNPPTNDLYCPDDMVTRGQMAAFLVRALGLTDDGGGDLFTDDDLSIFEGDIDRLGTVGITQGCNPPANDLYCPDDMVTRGQMAAFLYRGIANQGVADPVITTATLPGTMVGIGYAATLTATGGTAAYTWSLDSGALPTGINISVDGELTGNPQSSGVYPFTVAVVDTVGGSDTADLSITVVDADLEITTTSLPDGVNGEPYSYQLEASGGSPPYGWAVIGALPLPPDLTLSSDGLIAGTVDVPSGSGGIEFQVTDTDSTVVTKVLTMTVITSPVQIDTSTPLPSGTTGEDYQAEVNLIGGVRPVVVTVISGDLPAGIDMDSTGEFTGVPAVPGVYDFSVEAVDGATTSDTADLSISVAPGPMTVNALVRTNVQTDGTQGDAEARDPDLAAGGRYVVFETTAALAADDTNSLRDIYRHDLQTGETVRVSVDTLGGNPSAEANNPSISATGRYVAFESFANDLVAGDTNIAIDVFVRDMQAEVTTRVSVDSAGGESNGISQLPAISADGQTVVYRSDADNLIAADTNGVADVFVHDVTTGATALVSVDSLGGQLSSDSSIPAISGDGTAVAFSTTADGVVPGDTNGWLDVYVVELATMTVEWISVDPVGPASNGSSSNPSLSFDGDIVAFTSGATNLVADDTNGVTDVFVRKRTAGEVIRASAGIPFLESMGASFDPAMASGGRFVAFRMDGDELDPLDGNGFTDVYMLDIAGETLRRVSVRPDGAEGTGDSAGLDDVAVSGDGSRVVFVSDAENLVDDDSNGFRDIFVARLLVPPPS